MKLSERGLTRLTTAIFEAAGAASEPARIVAEHLVDANLAGHDSHGVIRISHYLELAARGAVRFDERPALVTEGDAFAVVDGRLAFGQVVGLEVVRLGVAKAAAAGVALIAARNAAHLGRIGAYAERAAEAGQASLHFANSTGFAMWTAPFGGRERRLSVSPIAVGFPVEGAQPIILDISTTRIAEGKVRVARNRGTTLPEGCIIDSEGNPSTDPQRLYGSPGGALLPFADHKGYGLNVVTDLLAGALTGGGCTNPESETAKLGMNSGLLSIFIAPALLTDPDGFAAEVRRFIAWVKSAQPVDPDRPVQVPGEFEAHHRAERRASGITLDDATWDQVVAAAAKVGLQSDAVEALVA